MSSPTKGQTQHFYNLLEQAFLFAPSRRLRGGIVGGAVPNTDGRRGRKADAALFRPPGGPLWGPRLQSGGRGPAARHERDGGRGGRGGARKGHAPQPLSPKLNDTHPPGEQARAQHGAEADPAQAGGEKAPRPRPPTSAFKSHIIRRARGRLRARPGAEEAERRERQRGKGEGGTPARQGGRGRGATRAAKIGQKCSDYDRAGGGGPEGRAALFLEFSPSKGKFWRWIVGDFV